MPYRIESNYICSRIAELCLLPGCPEALSRSPMNQSKFFEALPHLIETKTACAVEYLSVVCSPDAQMQCPEVLIPDPILPQHCHTKLNQTAYAVNRWVLCAPLTPRGNVLHSGYPIQILLQRFPNKLNQMESNSWALCDPRDAWWRFVSHVTAVPCGHDPNLETMTKSKLHWVDLKLHTQLRPSRVCVWMPIGKLPNSTCIHLRCFTLINLHETVYTLPCRAVFAPRTPRDENRIPWTDPVMNWNENAYTLRCWAVFAPRTP